MRTEVRDAKTAAAALDVFPGTTIEWCPGDMTRYEVGLLRTSDDRRALVVLNFSLILPLPDSAETAAWWISVAELPRGYWSGLRPLLAALGAAEGPPEYDRLDARYEGDLRHLEERRSLDARTLPVALGMGGRAVFRSEGAGYGPGRFIVRRFDAHIGVWFDVGDPLDTREEAIARMQEMWAEEA